MAALLAAVSTSCKKDEKTPAWFTNAKTNFKNGRFVPTVQDMLPASVLETNTATKASAAYTRAGEATLQFANLKGNCWGGLTLILRDIENMRQMMEECKQSVLSAFERIAPTEMGVWTDNPHGGESVKYEENANGGKFIYRKYVAGDATISIVIDSKLSMYSDGSTEIYYSHQESVGYSRKLYSYFKGDKFIGIDCQPQTGYNNGRMYSIDVQNGKKRGKSIGFNTESSTDSFGVMEFEGDEQDATVRWLSAEGNAGNSTPTTTGLSAYGVIDGIPYGATWKNNVLQESRQDIRMFANIKEITFRYWDSRPVDQYGIGELIGSVCGIKLTNNAVISESDYNDWGRFWLFVSAAYEKLDEYNWEPKKTGGIYCDFLMFTASDQTESPQTALPPALSGLQYKSGFNNLYTNLKSSTQAYFSSNYRITDIPQLANVPINYANILAIRDALLGHIETHHTGF